MEHHDDSYVAGADVQVEVEEVAWLDEVRVAATMASWKNWHSALLTQKGVQPRIGIERILNRSPRAAEQCASRHSSSAFCVVAFPKLQPLCVGIGVPGLGKEGITSNTVRQTGEYTNATGPTQRTMNQDLRGIMSQRRRLSITGIQALILSTSSFAADWEPEWGTWCETTAVIASDRRPDLEMLSGGATAIHRFDSVAGLLYATRTCGIGQSVTEDAVVGRQFGRPRSDQREAVLIEEDLQSVGTPGL
jgi:hypothetical protein